MWLLKRFRSGRIKGCRSGLRDQSSELRVPMFQLDLRVFRQMAEGRAKLYIRPCLRQHHTSSCSMYFCFGQQAFARTSRTMLASAWLPRKRFLQVCSAGSSCVCSNEGLGFQGVGFRKRFPLNKKFVAVKWLRVALCPFMIRIPLELRLRCASFTMARHRVERCPQGMEPS